MQPSSPSSNIPRPVAAMAVILAAGTASRLRPLTDHLPKSLIPVLGVPMLRRSMDNLLGLGIQRFVIVTGYLEAQIHSAVRSWYPDLDVTFFTNPAYATMNNGSSLLVARSVVDNHEFVLLDADIVYDPGVVEVLLHSTHPDCLALRRSHDLSDEEMKVELDAHGRMKRISKLIEPSQAAGESIGIERFGASTSGLLFEILEDRIGRRQLGKTDNYEDSFQELADLGKADIRVTDVGTRYCAEIDTPADLTRVEAEVRKLGWS